MMTAGVELRSPDSSALDRATGYLDENHVAYKVFDHEPRFTAASEAHACGVAPWQAAKTVVLRDAEQRFLLTVIPASERLDVRKVRRLLPAARHLRVAVESELSRAFSEFELGAVPPFGMLLGVPEVVDERLLEGRRVLCSGGDHRHSLLIDPVELVELAGARVGDLCKG
jgi:Ala-tRNA(Pro) deacylase